MNPSRICCCTSSVCGSNWGPIRPYSQTSNFAYRISAFASADYGPKSLLATSRIRELVITESQSVTMYCNYDDIECCGDSYQAGLNGEITCPTDRYFFVEKESTTPAQSMVWEQEILQCPVEAAETDSIVRMRYGCVPCAEQMVICSGNLCSTDPFCTYQFNQADPILGRKRVAWSTPTGSFGSFVKARILQSTEVLPVTLSALSRGTGTININRSTGFIGFTSTVAGGNGDIISVSYNHRADYSAGGNACEGQAATPLVTACNTICDCVSNLVIRIRLRQTREYEDANCTGQGTTIFNQVTDQATQDVILIYTGPLDGLLYDSGANSPANRKFKLLEAAIQNRGSLFSGYLLDAYYDCTLTSPDPAYNEQECGPSFGPSSTVNTTTVECENFCEMRSYPNPTTGVGEAFNVINATAAADLGFPAEIDVLRISP